MSRKFLIVFIISLIAYSILDFGFQSMMIYIMGGIVAGSIVEIFNVFNITIGVIPTIIIWTILLFGIIFLFRRLSNKFVKYVITILIALLLYVIDMIVNEIGTAIFGPDNIENALLLNSILISLIVLVKSWILTLIIYKDFNKS